MQGKAFDFTPLLSKVALAHAPAVARWSGFPRYNFVGGNNDPGGVPVEALKHAVATALGREGKTLATYNLESGPQGYLPLRRFIASQLHARRGIECEAEDVLVTSGSLQGLDLVNDLLLDAGDTVIVEQFTYGGALSRLARRGVRVVGVPLDEEGLRSDALADTLAGLAREKVTPKYIYTIPTVQNPTAAIMGLERRLEVLRLAGQYGIPVFEDECYADLVWRGERPPALRSLDSNGQVVYIGSFSKSIAPALRVGYLVADWPLMSRLLSNKQDAGSGAVEQMMLADFCSGHFDSHVSALNARLKKKAAALTGALEEYFGTAAEFVDPAGGIFLWVKLPPEVDTLALVGPAAAAGIAFNPGPEWATDADASRSSLRLCFANPSVETIREGIAKLAEVCAAETGVPGRIANVAQS